MDLHAELRVFFYKHKGEGSRLPPRSEDIPPAEARAAQVIVPGDIVWVLEVPGVDSTQALYWGRVMSVRGTTDNRRGAILSVKVGPQYHPQFGTWSMSAIHVYKP